MRILLIEDDPVIVDFMAVVLKKEGYDVECAESGMAALTVLQEKEIHLILLDLGLPDIDGIELLKILRKRMELPILIISARNNEIGKVEALDLGADDYITKPFGTKELLARIRTAMRHVKYFNREETSIVNGALKIVFDKHLLYVADQEVHLTKNEFRILKLLFQNLGKVVTYEQLMYHIWGPYAGDPQVIRVNMSNIRKKIEKKPLEPEYIITEIGVGYRMRDHRTSK